MGGIHWRCCSERTKKEEEEERKISLNSHTETVSSSSSVFLTYHVVVEVRFTGLLTILWSTTHWYTIHIHASFLACCA